MKQKEKMAEDEVRLNPFGYAKLMDSGNVMIKERRGNLVKQLFLSPENIEDIASLLEDNRDE